MDAEMQSQMLEDFSDPDFERSLAWIRDTDAHLRKIKSLEAALKAARHFIESKHDAASAVEAGQLLYAIDAALS